MVFFTSAVLVVKPGAAVFYYQIDLPMDGCAPLEGFSYRCLVNLPPALFPSDGVLLFEDGQPLSRKNNVYVSTVGDGCFTAEVNPNGDYYIDFAPSGNRDPFTLTKSYRAYFPVIFLSRTVGIWVLGLPLFGLLSFVGFAFSQAKALQDLRQMPREAWKWADRYLARCGWVIAGIQSSLHKDWRSFFQMWGRLSIVTGALACWLVLMEWVFLVTGVSFMIRMSLGEKMEVFLLSALFLTCLSELVILVLLGMALALRSFRLEWAAFLIAELVPSTLLVATIVLMVDNFTYVVFHLGILTSKQLLRAMYGVLIGILFWFMYWRRQNSWVKIGQAQGSRANFHLLSGVTLGVMGASLVAAILGYGANFQTTASANHSKGIAHNLPHILLIGSDGVNAENMSVYGYERDTTPNLRELRSTFLIAENAFTNSGATLGSIASIFTSKLPTETGVIYPPNILQGSDAFEHLPGILSRLGYKTVEIGVPHYVDAYTMNLQSGFDMVNGRESIQEDLLVRSWRNAGYASSAYFIYKLQEKLTNRLLHAFYLETIENPFDAVNKPASWLDDRQKMDQLLSLFSQDDQPIFVHVHLMGTHGPRFNIQEAKYSLGEEQSSDWELDFYDDAILAFDRYIGELVEALKTNGQYDHTLLILYSDHAQRFNTNKKIPLLFHFPGDEYAGSFSDNAQNLDIAPTVLDYLGGAVPTWMSGRSLLSASPGKDRLIYSAKVFHVQQIENNLWSLDVNQLQPPFYQFWSIQVIACNRWFELDLWTREWDTGVIEGHTAPCAEEALPSRAEMLQSIRELLANQGYDVSSLESK